MCVEPLRASARQWTIVALPGARPSRCPYLLLQMPCRAIRRSLDRTIKSTFSFARKRPSTWFGLNPSLVTGIDRDRSPSRPCEFDQPRSHVRKPDIEQGRLAFPKGSDRASARPTLT